MPHLTSFHFKFSKDVSGYPVIFLKFFLNEGILFLAFSLNAKMGVYSLRKCSQ